MLKVLGKSTGLLGIATVSNYFIFIFLARIGGAENFSQYLYNVAIAGVLSIIITYASQRIFTNDVLSCGNPQQSFDVVMSVRIILGGLTTLGLAVWTWFSGENHFLILYLLFFFVFNMGFLFEYHSNNVRYAAITLIEKLVFTTLCLVIIPWAGFSPAVYFIYFAGSAVSIGLQAFTFSNYVTAFNFATLRQVNAFLRHYLSFVLIDLVQLTYGNYSRLIIKAANGLVVFGAVSIAFQIIKIASIFQTQVEFIFRPNVIKAAKVRNLDMLRFQFIQYFFASTLPTLLGSIILFVFAHPIIQISFGDAFIGTADALKVVAWLPVLVNLMRYIEAVLIGLDKGRLCLQVNLGITILVLVGLLSVAPGSDVRVFLLLVVVGQLGYVVALFGLTAWYLSFNKAQQKNGD